MRGKTETGARGEQMAWCGQAADREWGRGRECERERECERDRERVEEIREMG